MHASMEQDQHVLEATPLFSAPPQAQQRLNDVWWRRRRILAAVATIAAVAAAGFALPSASRAAQAVRRGRALGERALLLFEGAPVAPAVEQTADAVASPAAGQPAGEPEAEPSAPSADQAAEKGGEDFSAATAAWAASDPAVLAAESQGAFQQGAMPGAPGRPRAGLEVIPAREETEGVGARVWRSVGGTRGLESINMDPFILLDEFHVGLPSGFPDHPHRGFETITYVLPTSDGAMTHEDFKGNAGTLRPGDLQWMTAARGILHSEVPESEVPAHGLQLWLNLGGAEKMGEPGYQEIERGLLTRVQTEGVRAIILAGEALGAASQVYTRTPCYYVHFMMAPNTQLEQPLPPEWLAFVYTLSGEASYAGLTAGPHNAIKLSQNAGEDGIVVKTEGSSAEFVVIAARSLGEPMYDGGLFVMCSVEELRQAEEDFKGARNGFEGAEGWRSQNALKMGSF